MEPMHETWLAVGNNIYQESPELIGASMGLRRSVFDKISGYDVELGPGKLGFGEDTLLWLQMKQLKLKIHAVNDLEVIHHPSASRLLRKSWISGAKQRGATEAYLLHHWKHGSIPFASLHLLINQFKLKVRRFFSKRSTMESEGCPAWEMSYESRVALIHAFLKESKKDRKHSHH
jgi:glucosyl-dolichyl phosphate glucuronosyltransferase